MITARHETVGFNQARLFVNATDSELESGNAGVGETVDDFRAQEAGVRGEIDPEALLRGVIDNFVNKIRTNQRFAPRRGQNAARSFIQPIDGTARCAFLNALEAIVGCLLTIANQLDVLLAQPFTVRLGTKIFVNFVIPFAVSSTSTALNRNPQSNARRSPEGSAKSRS